MQFWTLEETPISADTEREIAPGVRISRRMMLRSSLWGVGVALSAATLGGCRSAGPIETEPADAPPESPATLSPTTLSAGDVVHTVRPLAKDLIGSPRPDEDAYLAAVTPLLQQMVRPKPWRTPRKGAPYSMDTIAYFPPIVLYEIRMQPGSVIPIHDHRHYNGAIACVSGALHCRNFDIEVPPGSALDVVAGEVPAKGEDFVIRQTRNTVLGAGEVSTLTRARDNIHEVKAGAEGCRLFDLFTHFRPEARSYPIDWDAQPLDEGGDLYRAAWS